LGTAVARRRDPARLLILGTYRPVDAIVRAHPVRTVMRELTQHQQGAELPLDYLAEAEVTAYLAQRFGGLPRVADVARLLHQRTRGHPLFLVTMLDEMRRQGLLPEEATGWDVSKTVETIRRAVPEGLRHIIEQQLQQVSLADQGLLEAASLAGIEFSAPAIAAVVTQATEDVEARLAALAHHGQFLRACGLVEWPDGTVAVGYGFRHDLYREILYDRVPPSRQRRWHLQIGVQKETGYGAQAWQIAAELAVHFARGCDHHRALQYLQHAADNALRRFAYPDAITHLTNALALLAALPEAPAKAQQELDLRMALGPALMVTKGPAAPEVELTYARAWALCQQVGETPQRFPTLLGLWRLYQDRGALPRAQELGEQLLQRAQRAAVPPDLLTAHGALGYTLYFLGDYGAAQTHCAQGIALIDPTQQRALAFRYGVAAGVVCLVIAANTLWCLGSPTQAVQRSQDALALAQVLDHPWSLVYAQLFAAVLHSRRREAPVVQAQVEAMLTLVTAQGAPHFMGFGTCLRGWALAMQGQDAVGLEQMRQGMATVLATGHFLSWSLCLVVLAEAVGHAGYVDEGLHLLAEALTAFATSGRGDMLAEAYRLQGTLLLRQAVPDVAQAEACFQQALAIARRQQAQSWELRAAMSLSRLWQHQGKRAEAGALLEGIYSWFTEGFDTADLREAKALLEALV
jgi:predicted ATPase